MADWAKIALKIGLVVVIMAAIWVVFSVVQVPAIDFSVLSRNEISVAFAVMAYFCPVFPAMWNFLLVIFGVQVSLWTFRFGQMVVKWLFKVNE